MIRSASVVIAVLAAFGLQSVSSAQDVQQDHKTYFDNLTLDPDGHICYVEFLEGSDFNRIEYREEGRGMISLYETVEELAKYVETRDFNEDDMPDIITIDWTMDGTDIRRLTLYRGPQYKEHLVKHLRHALGTASRHIIRDTGAELQRSREIQDRLDELEKRPISDDEVGVFTTEAGFRPVDHKDIRYVFVAAGNLNAVLSDIVAGDYKVLSKRTELTKEYKLDIDILLSLDPSKHTN